MNQNGIRALVGDLISFSQRKGKAAFFVTGTDTGVGKTFIVRSLIHEFQRHGKKAVGFKPICCGDREDALGFWKLSKSRFSIDTINPVYLPKPVAPVSQTCPSWVTLSSRVRRAFQCLIDSDIEILLVEGAGGLLCPITQHRTMRDLACLLKLPLIGVAPNRLGVLNHSLLTLEAMRTSKLKCLAWVLTSFGKKRDLSEQSNSNILRKLISIPVYRA